MIKINIGTIGWEKNFRKECLKIDKHFFDGFTTATSDEMDSIEKELNRKLPKDFRLFYQTIGYGTFPFMYGHSFESPQEIIDNCHAPLFFVTGSMTPGSEWCSNELQREFYISNGVQNPEPNKFTSNVLQIDSIRLIDLLQFGGDGSCCYHQLVYNNNFSYCLLTDSFTIENTFASFNNALEFYINKEIEK